MHAGKTVESNGKNGVPVNGHGKQLKFTPSLLANAKENEMVQKYLAAETKKFSLKS